MKLIEIVKSSDPKKKYQAVFCVCKGSSKCSPVQRKIVRFGQSGLQYSKELAQQHKDAYQEAEDPFTAGALSRWILWNKSTLSASVADYKRHFNI